MRIAIPDFCLVVLIGASGSGKSTFARRHFEPTEVVSSDACRGMVEDDENSLDATADAFALLHVIAETRLRRRKLAVIDATNVRQEDRAHLVRFARKYHALAVAIVLDPGEDICFERNKARPDRQFGPHVVRNHMASLRRNIRRLDKEGFRYVHELRSAEAIDGVEIVRERLWTDARADRGARSTSSATCTAAPTSWRCCSPSWATWFPGPPRARSGSARSSRRQGRRAIFVGDLVDRGPRTPDVLRLVQAMVAAGTACACPAITMPSCSGGSTGATSSSPTAWRSRWPSWSGRRPRFRERTQAFLDSLVSHLWLDGGRLVVAHAGHQGGDDRARLRRGARVRPLRRDHRRDRRVRPARALQLGGGVSGQDGGRLRPHPGARARSG